MPNIIHSNSLDKGRIEAAVSSACSIGHRYVFILFNRRSKKDTSPYSYVSFTYEKERDRVVRSVFREKKQIVMEFDNKERFEAQWRKQSGIDTMD